MFQLVFAILSLALTIDAQAQTYRNPITTSFSCADPAVFKEASDMFYLSCTGGRFAIRRSDNLLDWRWTNKFLVNPGTVEPWAHVGRSWAPEITKINNKYVSYYTQNNLSTRGAIGVSWTTDINKVSFSPALNTALVSDNNAGGVIDPSYFYDSKLKKHYLLYKTDGNSIGRSTNIQIRELNSSGNSFIDSPRIVKVGGSKMENLVEGQDLIKKGNFYYLFYSYGDYTNSYKVKVARSTNIYGPYTGDKVILSGSSIFRAPGHGKVLKMPGKYIYFYHAYDNRINDNKRYPMIDEIHWKDDWPIVNNGFPSSGSQYVPTSTHSYFHDVTIRWNNVSLISPHYSLDIKDTNGNVIPHCLGSGVIRGENAMVFDGNCHNNNGIYLKPSTKLRVRICAAQNKIRGVSDRIVRCTKYKKMYDTVTVLEFD